MRAKIPVYRLRAQVAYIDQAMRHHHFTTRIVRTETLRYAWGFGGLRHVRLQWIDPFPG